jgi:hypothetical protein
MVHASCANIGKGSLCPIQKNTGLLLDGDKLYLEVNGPLSECCENGYEASGCLKPVALLICWSLILCSPENVGKLSVCEQRNYTLTLISTNGRNTHLYTSSKRIKGSIHPLT